MRNTSFAGMHCSIARSLELIGDWWTPLVLRDLYLGLSRFDQLVTDLGISRNLLTDRLNTLVEGGIVQREAYQDRPTRYAYALTEAGRELVPVLFALTAWGDKWVTPEGGPPIRFRHNACGELATAEITCSHCQGLLTADNVTPEPGPGGREAPGTALIGTVIARV